MSEAAENAAAAPMNPVHLHMLLLAMKDHYKHPTHGRLSVEGRRACERFASKHDVDHFIACDRCGESDEEGLCVYGIRRETRATEHRISTLCADCAEKHYPDRWVISS